MLQMSGGKFKDMKRYLIILISFFLSAQAIQAQHLVPNNLKESLVALDKYFDDKERDRFLKIAESNIVQAYNLSAGAYMRSHWGLNDESSELYQYFEERGVENAQQMSNIILISYHRVHHGNFINLENQIVSYIGEKHMKRVKKKLKKAGKEI